MPKTYSNTAVTNNRGVAALYTYCAEHEPFLIWRPTPNDDIGLDGEIEICNQDGQSTGEILKIQLKSTVTDNSYIKAETDRNFTFYADKNDVEYWQNIKNEVLLVVFDGREKKRILYAKKIAGFDTERGESRKIPIRFNKDFDLLDGISNNFVARFSSESVLAKVAPEYHEDILKIEDADWMSLTSQVTGDGNIVIQGVHGSNINIVVPAQEKPPQKSPSQKLYPTHFIPDLKYFVGREDLLNNIEKKLADKHRVSLHNLPGMGKTFTSYKYALNNLRRHEKIFFVNAAQESLMESLANLGQMLNQGIEEATQEQQALAFRIWLENNDGWLTLYDNVDSPSDLKRFVPNNLKGDCLFTSRDADIMNLGLDAEIDKLENGDAEQLLLKRVYPQAESLPEFSNEDERLAFERIIAKIDGLPIALTTTGAFINEKKLSFSEFWEAFDDKEDVILSSEDKFDGYENKSAFNAFAFALDEISAENGDDSDEVRTEKAAIREMLNAACFLFPDDIPEEFLQSFLEKNLTGFDISDKKLWIAVRNRFTNFDLFKLDSTAKSFSTHRLIQKCIFSRLSSVDKKAYAEKVLNILKGFFPNYDYTNKEQCERYYQHTLAALENADKIGFEAGVLVGLYYRVAWYQELLGSYAQAEKFYTRNLEISRKVYGEEAAETASSLNNLALVYDTQGKYDEAIGLYKQAMEIGEKTIGKDHPAYATRLNNLAEVYRAQGKYDEAIGLYKQAIEIGENTIGKEHPNYAIRLNNLGEVYRAQGKYDEAIKLYKQAIEIGERTIGKDHHDYATRLNNLAAVYDSQGKYEEAIGLYKQAIEIDEKTIGKEHPAYATRLNNMAWVYRNQEKYSDALPLFEEALRIKEAKLPPEHPSIANVKESVAFCKSKIGAG